MRKRKYKPRVKFTKRIADEICKKAEEGMSVAAICKKWPDRFPSYATVMRWRKSNKDFAKSLDEVYRIKMYAMLDELLDLTEEEGSITVDSIKEKYPNLTTPSDINNQIKIELARIRNRIDTLKYTLQRVAPRIVPEFSEQREIKHTVKQEIEHKDASNGIVIVNYSKKLDGDDDIDLPTLPDIPV